MSTTTQHLAAAWLQRASRIATELRHAEHAPALFRPEHVEQLRADLATAHRWIDFWAAQS